MQTLVAEDVRRIVNCGEQFLLVDLTEMPGKTAAHVSWDNEFVTNVLKQAGQTSLAIIIRGIELEAGTVERAADTLRRAGFLEVWTYFDAWPQGESQTLASSIRQNVVSDPDVNAFKSRSVGHASLMLR